MERPARLFDGITAAPRDVVARFGDDAIEIVAADGAVERWTTGEIRVDQWPDAGLAARVVRVETTAVLVVDDAAVAAWLRAHRIGRRPAAPRQRRLLWIAGGTIGAIALFAAGWATIVPAAIARMIPLGLEQSVGDGVVRQLTSILSAMGGKQIAVCTGAEGRAILDRLAARLAAASGTAYPLKLTVVDSPVMNALTAPGGRIVVLDGLLRYANGPDEFAGVLAHELGHVVHRDPTTGFIRSAGLTTLIDLATGGASGGGGLALAAQVLVTTSFGREAEDAADRSAVETLAAAGIDGRGLVAFFERLAKEKESGLNAPRMISTHPPSAERAQRLRAALTPGGAPAMSPADWLTLRRICIEGKG